MERDSKLTVLWGTGAPSLQMYYCMNDADRKDLLIAEDHRERREAAAMAGAHVRSVSEIEVSAAGLLILPTYGINLVKKMRRRLVEMGADPRRILVISPRAFREEIQAHGTLEALIERRKTKALYINSLEYEVAHHCNLNCRGCNHYSPLSEVKFGDPEKFCSDLRRILSFVDHVGEIRLLGGEPLLNPELYRFVEEARRLDPSDPISVMTNGILLPTAPERLMEAMKSSGAVFGITVYPPVRAKMGRITKRLEQAGVRYKLFHEVDMFNAQLNPDGDSDPAMAESVCFSSECHIFEDGFLSKCSVAHKYPVYRECYGLPELPGEQGLALYDEGLSADKLLRYLLEPNEMCRYCGRWKLFPWEQAGKEPAKEDWYGAGAIR